MMLKIALDNSERSLPQKEAAIETVPVKITSPLPLSLQNSLATLIQCSFAQLPSQTLSTVNLDSVDTLSKQADRIKVETKETMTEEQPDSKSDSIYILVQKEKRKYQLMMEKVIEDKKKKASEIDNLKVEIDLLKRVMNLAGVSVETKDLQAILRNSTVLTGKSGVLPPIPKLQKKTKNGKNVPVLSNKQKAESKEECKSSDIATTCAELVKTEPEILIPFDKIVDNAILHEEDSVSLDSPIETELEFESHLERSISPTTNATYKDTMTEVDGMVSHSEPVGFRNDADSGGIIKNELNLNELTQNETLNDLFSEGITAITPPTDQKKPGSFRSSRYKLKSDPSEIPAILTHNQNLDYNNRAHLYLDSYSYVESDASSATKVPQIGNGRKEKTLPPIVDRKGVLGLAKESFKNAKTTYSGRFWRAKIVKDKQLKDLHEKTL
ncbi:hypothetical protein HK103_002514 [Boothiomyces macroporosus]|uniref:Uncharacterized protein n=1 Tax=Boothiomyces macroporosus TaxID=261099 RepID=A0AAD5Y4R0_9FUNG|nr:hypothetical protein HK103_002514 [Boothiomyces macroporosus]